VGAALSASPSEAGRLAALRDLGILDTPPDPEFDALVRAASLVCGVPISLVSLVDEARQWFKASIGLPGVQETPRELAFCAHAILCDDLMEVPDATHDTRFADNALVTHAPDIRFYAGMPLRLASGEAVGTLCVIDRTPRSLTDTQRDILRCLGRSAAASLESCRLRRRQAEAAEALLQSEAKLRRSETLLRRIGRIAGIGGWEYDLTADRGICSEQACLITGLAAGAEMTLEQAVAFVAPEGREPQKAAIARAVAGGGGWDLEVPVARDDGTRIWVRSVGEVDLAGGRATHIIGSVQDITEQVDQRLALRRTHERLALATESAGIGIWDWDLVGGQVVWDARTCALYGVPAQDSCPGHLFWQNCLHPDDRARTEQAVQDCIDGVQPYDIEFRIVWPDGTLHHLHATARVTRDATGRAVRMVGADWDVTERRAAEAMQTAKEAAEKALRAKSEFLATMSHEIRSPLGALMGVLELLRATPLDPEQGRMAGMIQNSAEMLLAVLNDILDFSKIEAGAMSVQLAPTRIGDLIAEVAQPYASKAAHKRLAFTMEFAPDVPEWVLTDGFRLRQIVNNLLSNAIKFTSAGEIGLAVCLEDGAAGPVLAVSVRDSGIGIDESAIGTLFQPFVQADGSTSRRFGGTGLGLSISSKLAALLEGGITATSRPGDGPGSGSVFRLWMRLQPCAAPLCKDPLLKAPLFKEAAANAAGSAFVPAAQAQTRGRALVVDDDATTRWLTQRQLAKLGLDVDVASDGKAGLQKLLASPYDVLLTDCHMPTMDGVALTKAVRGAAEERLRHLPVIGLTADVTEAQRDLCTGAGMTALAIKPLTIQRLSALLEQHKIGRSEG